MQLRPQNYNDLAKEILLRLGGGVNKIEITPDQFDFAMKNTFRWFSIKKGKTKWKTIQIYQDVNEYALPGDVEEILECIPQMRTWRNADNIMFSFEDMFFYSQSTLKDADLLFTQMSQLGNFERMISADFSWEFIRERRILRINPPPTESRMLVYTYSSDVTGDDFVDLPLKDIMLIQRYAIAQCKLLLGTNRRKFGSYTGGSGEISIDAQSLIDEGKEELEKLEVEIFDTQEPTGIMFG
jgi:hypothetical protein